MNNAKSFRNKLADGTLCMGTCITFNDPTVSECLTTDLDFLWIDGEHQATTLEVLQGHIMATKGTDCAALVRVPWNDPVLIKPVLDIGADGVIVPFIRTADDVRRAVAACQYPPVGIRGFGPRRPSDYGRRGGPEFCREVNENTITIVQIEHIDAVNNIEEILAVPGLTSIAIGPNDLSGSIGLLGQPQHPDVIAAIDKVLEAAIRANIPVGISIGDDPKPLIEWADKGMSWLAIGGDFTLMIRAVTGVAAEIRAKMSRS